MLLSTSPRTTQANPMVRFSCLPFTGQGWCEAKPVFPAPAKRPTVPCHVTAAPGMFAEIITGSRPATIVSALAHACAASHAAPQSAGEGKPESVKGVSSVKAGCKEDVLVNDREQGNNVDDPD